MYHGTPHSSKDCAKLLELIKEATTKPPYTQPQAQPSPTTATKHVAKLAESTSKSQPSPKQTTEPANSIPLESTEKNSQCTYNP